MIKNMKHEKKTRAKNTAKVGRGAGLVRATLLQRRPIRLREPINEDVE